MLILALKKNAVPMKKPLLFVVLAVLGFQVYAQQPGDTIEIRTFNYSQTYGINQWSPGIRDSVIDFSTLPDVSFEKVLMTYNMRCKDAKVSTQNRRDLGCGEWDASCNTYLHDSSRIDSVLYKQPDYVISGFSGDEFTYTSIPQYDYYEHAQQSVVVNSITTEDQYSILSGTSTMINVLDGSKYSGKSQFLYTAAELTAAGFSAGDIDGFLVNAINGGTMRFLKVNIKETSATAIDASTPELNGFSEVYFSDYDFLSGSNRIQFHTPFAWNGTDNLIIELSFTNNSPEGTIGLEGTASTGKSIYANNGYHANLSGNSHIDVDTKGMASIDEELTVSLWVYGNPEQLPANTSVIYGEGANGERDLNIHLPWSNSNVYFDCGDEGSGYDRINKEAKTEELEGQWNHWAFVKNASTGTMQIYLNGALWSSGSDKNRTIDIAKMVVGKSSTYSNNYKGSVDELRIWDKALSQATIEDWMNVSIDASHPNYSNLVAYYPMDEGTGVSLADASSEAATSTASSKAIWASERGSSLSRFFKEEQLRPSITLFRGSYDLSKTSKTVLDSSLKIANLVQNYEIVSHPNVIKDDERKVVSETELWEAVAQNVYEGNTDKVLRTIPVKSEGSISPQNLNYYRRWPAKVEIMSFVTPYGVGLDLGKNGKTWTFDMTDYLPIFKGQKRMTIERGGQWMEDMDIRFLFIVGTPPRNVLDFDQLWRPESRPYSQITSNRYFKPVSIELDDKGSFFKVRTAVTGHGQEGEFIPQNHFVNVDGGSNEFVWQAWKECAENPVYPQGGTWIYDRAGWCPGMATDVQHHDITPYVTAGETASIDYGVMGGSGTSNYIVNSQLISYGPANHSLDAAVMAVKEPSNRVEYQRFSSVCNNPKVIIQNTGSTALTSLTINYWVNDASTPEVFEWTGDLAFLATEEVELPAPASLWESIKGTGNAFHVSVSEPNAGTDEYEHNDSYTSYFKIPEVVPSRFVVYFQTNTTPYESSYEILDAAGNAVLSRSGLSANTLYKDTLRLDLGCYTYVVKDADDDGIDFWANDDGLGSTRFIEVGGPVIKAFEGDFGDRLEYSFTVNFPLSYDEVTGRWDLNLYPNPNQGSFTLEGKDLETADVSVVDHVGKRVAVSQTVLSKDKLFFNTTDLARGIYFIQIQRGDRTEVIKTVIK